MGLEPTCGCAKRRAGENGRLREAQSNAKKPWVLAGIGKAGFKGKLVTPMGLEPMAL